MLCVGPVRAQGRRSGREMRSRTREGPDRSSARYRNSRVSGDTMFVHRRHFTLSTFPRIDNAYTTKLIANVTNQA